MASKLVDKATSSENLDPDWETIMAICDNVRSKVMPFKKILQLLKKKLHDKNPHVQHFALMVLEACMKNCGAAVHDEVATRAFMDDLHDLLRSGVPPLVKNKVLDLVQAWKHAFRNDSKYSIVEETFNKMQREGFDFPALVDTAAMFVSEAPPDWVDDSEVKNCHLCRSGFSVVKRRHHCRNCGNVFCTECSAKSAIIPKFGYETPVRVCDTCSDKLDGKPPSTGGTGASGAKPSGQGDGDLPLEYLQSSLAKESQVPATRDPARQRELEEEDQLQLAMAMSLNEEENKKQLEQQKKKKQAKSPSSSASRSSAVSTSASASPAYASSTSGSSHRHHAPSEPAPYQSPPSQPTPSTLPHYGAPSHGHWDQVPAGQPYATAAAYEPTYQPQATSAPAEAPAPVPEPGADGDLTVLKSGMQKSIGMFVERMQAVSGQGRSIALDASVQALFHSLSSMHPPLLAAMEEQDEKKAHFVDLEKKLKEAKEARVSLNAMRRTHAEKVKQQQSELEMLAKIQMQQKLELLRQQKSEQLEHMEVLRKERQGEFQKHVQQQQQFEVMQQTEAQQALVYQQQQLLQEQQAQIQAMSAALTQNEPGHHPPPAVAPGNYQPGLQAPAQYEAAPSQPLQQAPLQQFQQAGYVQQQPPAQASYHTQPQQFPPQQQHAPQQQLPPQQHAPQQQLPPQQHAPQQQLPPQQHAPQQQAFPQQHVPQQQAPPQQQQPVYHQPAPASQHQPAPPQQQPPAQYAVQQPLQHSAPVPQQYGSPATGYSSYGYEGNLMPASGTGVPIPAGAGGTDQQLISFD